MSDDAQNDAHNLTDQLAELREEMKLYTTMAHEDAREIKTLKDELGVAAADRTRLQKKVVEQERLIAQQHEEVYRLSNQNFEAQVNQEMAERKQETTQVVHEQNDLLAQQADIDTETIRVLQTSLHEALYERDRLSSELPKVIEEREEAMQRAVVLEEHAEHLRQSNQAMAEKLNALQGHVAAMESEDWAQWFTRKSQKEIKEHHYVRGTTANATVPIIPALDTRAAAATTATDATFQSSQQSSGTLDGGNQQPEEEVDGVTTANRSDAKVLEQFIASSSPPKHNNTDHHSHEQQRSPQYSNATDGGGGTSSLHSCRGYRQSSHLSPRQYLDQQLKERESQELNEQIESEYDTLIQQRRERRLREEQQQEQKQAPRHAAPLGNRPSPSSTSRQQQQLPTLSANELGSSNHSGSSTTGVAGTSPFRTVREIRKERHSPNSHSNNNNNSNSDHNSPAASNHQTQRQRQQPQPQPQQQATTTTFQRVRQSRQHSADTATTTATSTTTATRPYNDRIPPNVARSEYEVILSSGSIGAASTGGNDGGGARPAHDGDGVNGGGRGVAGDEIDTMNDPSAHHHHHHQHHARVNANQRSNAERRPENDEELSPDSYSRFLKRHQEGFAVETGGDDNSGNGQQQHKNHSASGTEGGGANPVPPNNHQKSNNDHVIVPTTTTAKRPGTSPLVVEAIYGEKGSFETNDKMYLVKYFEVMSEHWTLAENVPMCDALERWLARSDD